MFAKMAGWCSGSESEDEPLNMNLFNRKSFAFEGFTEKKENTLKNIVKQLGGTCDSTTKYIFTTVEYYNSLTHNAGRFYNVTFIRDCVDANRYLSVEQYRLEPKTIEKKDYRDFDPCCFNFHGDQNACIVCDPAFKTDVLDVKKKRKYKSNNIRLSDTKTSVINKKIKTKNFANTNGSGKADTTLTYSKKNHWEPWECRVILDYIICNNLFGWAKSPSLYKRMSSEGFLTHRSSESMRVHFRKNILRCIESYDLPKAVINKLKQIRNCEHPVRAARYQNKLHLKKQVGSQQIKK